MFISAPHLVAPLVCWVYSPVDSRKNESCNNQCVYLRVTSDTERASDFHVHALRSFSDQCGLSRRFRFVKSIELSGVILPLVARRTQTIKIEASPITVEVDAQAAKVVDTVQCQRSQMRLSP